MKWKSQNIFEIYLLYVSYYYLRIQSFLIPKNYTHTHDNCKREIVLFKII